MAVKNFLVLSGCLWCWLISVVIITSNLVKLNVTHFFLSGQLLLINPSQRPNINEILGELSELASMREVRVSGSIPLLEEVAKRRNVNVTANPTSQPISK